MGLLEDVMKTLERIPVWKRLSTLPAEVEALKSRIEAIEAKLSGATGDACPKCGEMSFRIISNHPMDGFEDMGVFLDVWKCDKCSYSVEKRST